MEKKGKYEFAEVELIRFDVKDIITTSTTEHGDSGGNGDGWTNTDIPYIDWS